jgi:hypothetical protein
LSCDLCPKQNTINKDYFCVVTDHIYLYIQSPVNCSMDTRSNRKNDAPHTTYHTPHIVSITIQQPRNFTGPRLGPRTLDRTSTGINSRSTGGHQHVGKKSSGRLKTSVSFVCFWIYYHTLILCAFLPTLCGPELVRCAHIAITDLVPQFLYMCFHPPVHPGPRQYCWYAILAVLSVSLIQD